jgi:hypothetical protein
MNVLSATNLLFDWFSKNDCFELNTDFNKLILLSEDQDRDKATVLASLEDLENKELISKTKFEHSTYWILKQPFNTFPQNVEIQPQTALAIGELINNFCEVIQDDTDTCDSSNITGKDINNLVLIAGHLSTPTEESVD